MHHPVATPSSHTTDLGQTLMAMFYTIQPLSLSSDNNLGQEGLSFSPRAANFEGSQHGMAHVAWFKKVSWAKDKSLLEDLKSTNRDGDSGQRN